jgi:RNA recognition motif-containing protein
MSKKLFVGGLSWGTGDVQLKAAFEPFGVTDAKVILDVDTGRSRGFGFVTLADDDAAERARAELDGSELDGRTIRVNLAEDKPRPARSASGPGSDNRGGASRPGRSDSGGPPRSAPTPYQGDKRRGGRPEGGGRGEDKFGRRRNTAQREGRDGRGRDSGTRSGGDDDDEY